MLSIPYCGHEVMLVWNVTLCCIVVCLFIFFSVVPRLCLKFTILLQMVFFLSSSTLSFNLEHFSKVDKKKRLMVWCFLVFCAWEWILQICPSGSDNWVAVSRWLKRLAGLQWSSFVHCTHSRCVNLVARREDGGTDWPLSLSRFELLFSLCSHVCCLNNSS